MLKWSLIIWQVLSAVLSPFKAIIEALRTWRIKRTAIKEERREVAREQAEKRAELAEDAKKHRSRTSGRSDAELDKRLSKWTRGRR